MNAQYHYPALSRAKMFLESAQTQVEEALADVALADRSHPEKQNEISKLRVKINRTKLRLRTLARHAETLSKNEPIKL